MNIDKFICSFCNSQLSSKSNLNTHLKTNKKCLVIRNCNIEDIYYCKTCKVKFSCKKELAAHNKDCKNELNKKNKYITSLQEEIKQLKLKNKYLENELKILKETNNNINITNSNFNSNNKVVNKIVINNYLDRFNSIDLNNLEIDEISILCLKEPKLFDIEYANHILNNSELKHKVIVKDNSKTVLNYKQGDSIVNDRNAELLISKTLLVLKEKIITMIEHVIDKLSKLEKKKYIDEYILELKVLIDKLNNEKYKNFLSKSVFDKALKVTQLDDILKEYTTTQSNSDKYITFVKSEIIHIEEEFLKLLEYRQKLIDKQEEKIKINKTYKLQQKLKDSLERSRIFYETQQALIDNNIQLELEEKNEEIRLKDLQEEKHQEFVNSLKEKHSINNTKYTVKNEENKLKYTGNYKNSKEDRYTDFSNLYNYSSDSDSD